jgi:hypothetical protein
MDELKEAQVIVRRAEAEVQKLLVAGAGRGAYEVVAKLVDLARELRRLADHVAIANGRAPLSLTAESLPERDGYTPSPAAVPSTRLATRDGSPARLGTKRAKGQSKGEYPLFCRDRDELVKIGWSKKKKAEYRHQAPWEVVLTVVRTLQDKGSTGEKFSFDELLPIRMPSGAEVPSYQAYLVLAWLRHENLIIQHGRRGYSLPPAVNLTNMIQDRWKRLPRCRTSQVPK